MNRLRVTAAALLAFAGVLGGCGNAGGGELLAPEPGHHADVIAADPMERGGWVGSGHAGATATDSAGARGGGWVGSGH